MKRLIIDAQLLVLVLVGLLDTKLIGKHKRTKVYALEDYEILKAVLESHDEVVVTPNVLTEASNLIRLIGDPQKTQLTILLRAWIDGDESEEHYIESSRAAARDEFPRLGLTDGTILELMQDELELLTADLDLYLSASAAHPARTTNFNHLRSHLGV